MADGGGATQQYFCESCNEVTAFEGDVGFMCCLQCGSQTQDIIATDVAADDMFGEDGGGTGLYRHTLHRRVAVKEEPPPGQVLDFNQDDKPRDFGPRQPLPDIETVARAIRSRYVEGLQLMVRRQCEVLVEMFNVSPLICGMARSIWLRYVAASGVFKEGWETVIIANCKDRYLAKPLKGKNNSKRRAKKASISLVLRTLRKSIPIYSTLVISLLSCHLAREPVLPTDIIDWVLEAKLPYLSCFVEMDRYIGPASAACPLANRTMFRPTLLLGSWQLEVVVGKTAKKIGLQLPPVYFYALARRWLKELTLPMEILPYACRIHEWLLPTEMWIYGSNFFGCPTRVVAMSVMIITLRILYNINGFGTWEKSLSSVANKKDPVEDATMDASTSTKFEFDARELLKVLEAIDRDIEVKHDYPKDLDSYLKYCKDVISAEMTCDANLRVNKTIQKCSNIYNSNEDGSDIKPENLNSDQNDVDERRYRDDATVTTSFDSSINLNPGNNEKKCSWHNGVVNSSLGDERKVDVLRFEMEENQFCYLAPASRRNSKGYITYKRVNTERMLVYAVHADYYIMLRTLAKVVRADMRLLHTCTLAMERKLAWFEERIIKSLNIPRDQPEGRTIQRREFDLDPGSLF